MRCARKPEAGFPAMMARKGEPWESVALSDFGSTGGPPMNNVLYNNMYQFVQTEDYLMIMVEMVHDTRIIPINKEHRPGELQQWLGDTVAHWDGDTLVVETVNLHPQQAPRNSAPIGQQGKNCRAPFPAIQTTRFFTNLKSATRNTTQKTGAARWFFNTTENQALRICLSWRQLWPEWNTCRCTSFGAWPCKRWLKKHSLAAVASAIWAAVIKRIRSDETRKVFFQIGFF